jgi:hypothetical protein
MMEHGNVKQCHGLVIVKSIMVYANVKLHDGACQGQVHDVLHANVTQCHGLDIVKSLMELELGMAMTS